ncbi:MAG: lipoate--protein ligase, partial [Anaerolineae bacterium]|nr:lipoate--protein ligase [Anaerolineae bacterium]
GSFNDFETFTKPVVQVLRALGVPAELSGRNDILVAERKVSGNAQYKTGSRIFSHGTLLFDTNLENVVAALNVQQGKIASKGIQSVRSRVANIKEFLDTGMDIQEFKHRLLQGIFNTDTDFPSYVLTDQDWEKIHQIKTARYDLWTWNFGKSPKFNVQKSHRFPIGEIDVRIDVAQGKINGVQIYGDFLGGEHETQELADLLIGVPYETAAVTAALAAIDVATYFGPITNSDFIKLLF